MENECNAAGCVYNNITTTAGVGAGVAGHYHLLETFTYEIPVTIVEVMMAVAILFGNGLVIAAYISDRKLRTVSNFFLVNLVIADFIVGVTLPISCSIYFIPYSQRTSWLCILQFSIIAVPLGSSTLCLLLITVERYLSVVNPFHHQQIFTKFRRYILVAISWALATLIMGIIPFALTKSSHTHITQKADCDMTRVIPFQYWAYVVLPLAYVLFGSVITIYMKILSVARHQIKSIELLVLQVSVSDKKNIQNVRLARTGFILLGLFIICWLPFTISLTITVVTNYRDNQALTIARIASMVLAPASSAINPIIYAARIRRFKIRIKRILHLPISSSDKYDTYEIRQSFRVKRTVAASPVKKMVEPVVSIDSGVGASNDDDSEEICMEPTDIYDHFRHRALSRISESPENQSQLGSSSRLQTGTESTTDTRRSSVSYSTGRRKSEVDIPSIHRKVKPPQFLDLPNTTRDQSYVTKTSYTEEHSSTTVYDNIPSPYMRVKTPSRSNNRVMTPGQRNSTASIICAEPIIIDCDDKSEYFRLVVRRTVRDCSDSESESDCDKSKPKTKMKSFTNEGLDSNTTPEPCVEAGTPDGLPKRLLTPTPGGSRASTLERNPRITNIHHQRSASGLSASSVGIALDNDDIQFEITNTNTSSKRMNRFMQLSQASLQRRQKKQQKSDVEESDGYSAEPSTLQGQKNKVAPPLNFVRDIWDGTLRRLRRSGRSKALLRKDKDVSVTSPSKKLSRQLSHSLTDISQMSQMSMPTVTGVVHQRSRSALAANEVYITSHSSSSPEETALTISPRIQSKSQRSSLHIDINEHLTDNNRLSAGNQYTNVLPKLVTPATHQHIKTTTQHKRTRVASWSHNHNDSETQEYAGVAQHVRNHDNNNYNTLQIPTDNISRMSGSGNTATDPETPNETIQRSPTSAPHTTRDFGVFRESFVRHQHHHKVKTCSIPSYYKGGSGSRVNEEQAMTDVMLPVKLRLPGGIEQDIMLTKQDIYGNYYKPKRRHKSNDVTLKRKRSMSQPNLNVRNFAR